VERRRGALRDPRAVLESADEDLLGVAEPLLERRPGDLDVAGDDGAARDVDQAGVLFRVDGVRRVVVDLGAARRERHEGGGCGGSQYPGEHRRETERVGPAFHFETSCSVRGSGGCVCLSTHRPRGRMRRAWSGRRLSLWARCGEETARCVTPWPRTSMRRKRVNGAPEPDTP